MTIATATEELPDLDALRREQAILRDRLARLRRRLGLQSALESLVDAAVLLTAVAAVLVLIDWQWRLGSSARLAVLLVVGPIVLAMLGIRSYRRWRASRIDDLGLAMTLDRFRPGTGQRVADVLQLPELLGDPAGSSSPSMVRLAVRRATESLSASDWHLLWNRGRTRSRLAGLLGCLALPVAFVLLAPEAARLSVHRWLLGSSERWPQQTYLSVVGLGEGNRLIAPRDEPFAVEVRSDLPEVQRRGKWWQIPGRGSEMLLRREPGSSIPPSAVSVRERIPGRGRRDGQMTAVEPSRFRFEFPPSDESTTFGLFGGDDWLGPITIERVDRPSIASIGLRVRDPDTPPDAFRKVDDPRQHPTFLPDSELELILTASEPIAGMTIEANPGAIASPARVDERTFASRWTLDEATTLEIRLTSEATGLQSRPAFLSIGLLKDREPRVSLRALGVGARVTPVATIPLSLAATDDFGLAALRLLLDRTDPVREEDGEDRADPASRTNRETVPLALAASEGRAVLDHQARHDVDLLTDPPAIGTTLRIIAEADDSSTRGTQTGRSGTLQFQVVSPDELFYDILIRQRAERAKFLTALEAIEGQGPALADEPDREASLTAVRVLHTNSRQIGQIADRIADTLQEMKLNQIGSPKSHRLLQEGVIDPIRALDSGAIAELRGVLQALGGGSPKAGADAEAARTLHAEVVDEMRAILEQMSQWESFIDVVNQVAEVIKIQQSILDATEKVQDSRTEEIFDELP